MLEACVPQRLYSEEGSSVFLRRLLRKPSTIDCGLPYNWNWQRRWSSLDRFLSENPIVLMDIGARGDAPPELDSIRRHVQRIGFEADPDECRRLNREKAGRFYPALLAGAAGEQTLHLYSELGYSSTLTLSERYQRLFTGPLPITGSVEMKASTLDGFMAEHGEAAPDIIKLDTQGTELPILEGAQRTLAGVGLVEVEVEFSPIYEEQPLFGDVARFMAENDFELLYLNRVFVTRSQQYRGRSRGQVLFGDALFGKRESCLEGFTSEQRAKYAILLCQYGHMDIAWQLFHQWPDLGSLVPEVHSAFSSEPSLARRALFMQLDKLLAGALHLRRYNHRGTDSDRVWPIR